MNEKTENISLGGNIELKGFQNAEKAKLVVLKKIIGNYARQMKEKRTDYERLIVSFDEDSSSIKAELFAGGNSLGGEDNQKNIFMAVDNALKKIIGKI